MAWSTYQKFLALLMVVTGSVNTIATKWADKLKSTNSEGNCEKFNHPFVQACSMFLGEFLCLLAFKLFVCCKRQESNGIAPTTTVPRFNPLVFWLPALCDLTGTSLMYIGLNLTYASSFQMLRGAVIVFTGLFSTAFLNRRLSVTQWSGIAVVIGGLACVGASDFLYPDPSENHGTNSVITGDLLIILAQIIVATQMVVEEKFVSKYNVPPLLGVGWEGFFGFLTLGVLLIPMYYIHVGNTIFNNPQGRMEDALDAFTQMANNWKVIIAITGTILSIAFFNFSGLSVTKEMSATTRMVLDSVRTFTVWVFSLAVRWQDYHYLQLLGFLVLLVGMCLYNDVILKPTYLRMRECYKRRRNDDERKPLVRSTDEESQSPFDKTRSTSINA